MTNLRPLTNNDARLIGGIIGRSFHDDPVNLWAFNGASALIPFYTAMARKRYLRKGFGHVTRGGTGGSMWLPPHVPKDIPILQNLDIIASIVRHGGLTALRNGLKTDACMTAHKPKEPCYYLFTIGTLPEYQGKGLGSRILAAGLEVVDAARMPAYLESTKFSSISFYQKFGFEVLEKAVPAPDAPPFWPMWRPASLAVNGG
ncbi:MAG: GNAT family N-acetyltransferase [Maricaulaceae bacterium]